jgi:hypothetical protein
MTPLQTYPIRIEKDVIYLKELRMQTKTFDPIKILERAFQEILVDTSPKTAKEVSLPLLSTGSTLLFMRLPEQAAAISTIYETRIKNLTRLELSTQEKLSVLKKEIALLEKASELVDWPDGQLELLLRQIAEKNKTLADLDLALDLEELEEIVDLKA